MFGSHTRQRHGGRARNPYSVRPQLETLEDRLVLNAGHGVSGTVLTVTSDAGSDCIHIHDPGTAAGLRILTNGTWKTIAVPVTEVRVNGNGGNDCVEYLLTGHLRSGVARKVLTNLGSGTDKFLARTWNPATGVGTDLLPGSRLSLVVQGGDGSDNLCLQATRDTDVMGTAALTVDWGGGAGNDVVSVNYRGELDGDLFLTAGGQEGDDTMNAALVIDAGSGGRLRGTSSLGVGASWTPARVSGHDGNDRLNFSVRNFGAASVSGLVVGGTGTDVGTWTPNITPDGIP